MYETKDLINDLRQITKTLYKEQLIFLIKQNYEFEEAMKQICSDEVLSEFCLNGEIKDYYPNGKLRQQGKYIQSKRDGIFCWYFPDGTLEKQEKYELGRYKCTYEKYFHNGSLLIKGNEKGILEQYDIYGNKIK
jgi:antitoxin component YwqK of YwqJK toxin-antitoxin module